MKAASPIHAGSTLQELIEDVAKSALSKCSTPTAEFTTWLAERELGSVVDFLVNRLTLKRLVRYQEEYVASPTRRRTLPKPESKSDIGDETESMHTP